MLLGLAVNHAKSALINLVVKADVEVPEIEYQWDAPGVSLGTYIVGWIMTLASVALAGVAIWCTIMLASKHITTAQGKAQAWTALIVCGIAAAFLGSITGYLMFAGNLKLF